MSKTPGSDQNRDISAFLFPKIYALLPKSPKILEKQKKKEQEAQDKLKRLAYINSISKVTNGPNSIEVLRSEAELGFFYNENLNPQAAIRQLEKAYSLEKENKNILYPEESINITIELALAYLYLVYEEKPQIKKVYKLLEPIYNLEIENSMIRFKQTLLKSRVNKISNRISKALDYYEKAVSSIQEANNNEESEIEALLYVEIAQTIEENSKSIPNSEEQSSQYYMKAHKFFIENEEDEFANIIDQQKLPESYRKEIELLKEKEKSLDTDKIQFICKNEVSFEQTPSIIQNEVIKIQKQIQKGNNSDKITIEFIPENLPHRKNESDEHTDYNNININNENTDNNDVIEKLPISLPVPPPSKVVQPDISTSQMFILSHHQLEIPKESKEEDIKKYVQSEKAAKAITEFNNLILSMSRYKIEMERKQDENKENQQKEDQLARFRSRRRKV